jgi:hypothetical protein
MYASSSAWQLSASYDGELNFALNEPVVLNEMSFYRGYFVPGGTDPSGTSNWISSSGVPNLKFDCKCTAQEILTIQSAWKSAISGADSAINEIGTMFDTEFAIQERQKIYKKFRLFFEKPIQPPLTAMGGQLSPKLAAKPTLNLATIVGPIQTVLRQTRDGMKNDETWIYCGGRSCDGKTKAYHDARGFSFISYSIVFCPEFFISGNARDRASWTFHEGSHRWAWTTDHDYMTGRQYMMKVGSDIAPEYEGGILSESKLIDNASTYENFLWKFHLK